MGSVASTERIHSERRRGESAKKVHTRKQKVMVKEKEKKKKGKRKNFRKIIKFKLSNPDPSVLIHVNSRKNEIFLGSKEFGKSLQDRSSIVARSPYPRETQTSVEIVAIGREGYAVAGVCKRATCLTFAISFHERSHELERWKRGRGTASARFKIS